jgi:aryl-alcohol dehydrogenase-like predicted oxidoreductase
MTKGYGIAEETVGRWLQRSGRRDDIVLATKVYQPMGLGPNDRRLSAYHSPAPGHSQVGSGDERLLGP